MDNSLIEFRPRPPNKPTKPDAITLKNYSDRALKFAQETGQAEFPMLTLGTPECIAWERYFSRHLGGFPWAFRALKADKIQTMTVPTQWPEWFDLSYVGPDAAT